MKTTKILKTKAQPYLESDSLRRAAKLSPNKKSGKDRIIIDDEDDEDLLSYKKKESVLDYFDDEEEDF
ncbi:MAG: hypothetical protein R3Y15_07990 [Rikenellaceae bacterium]